MPFRALLSVALLSLAACAGGIRPAAPAARGAPADRIGDARLHRILDSVPLPPAAEDSLHEYELDHRRDFMERVSLIAEDPAASVAARYNAVRLVGERAASAWLVALDAAATDPDPRVRAAVVVAAGRIFQASKGVEGRGPLVRALDDPAAEVQGKALEYLGIADPSVLRAFIAKHPRGEVSLIARTLLRTAEERGIPLAADSAGVLSRSVPDGPALEFRPARRWPEWRAAAGTLTLIPAAGGAPVRIEGVEVVRDVVPAFFSPDARFLVYEAARTIFVRDLQSGSTREVGPGIAPRPLPFTGDFVYLREDLAARAELRERTRLRYQVLRASFEGTAAPRTLDVLGAFSQMDASGRYAPARWMQVVERDGKFTLEAANLETFELPDPFKAGARP